jgi:glycosyltransferase involved in cell wall biosynthesis
VRVIMLSWEYPPRLVGGIARHVQELSEALAAQGVQVHVITATHPDAPDEAVENGVHLHRVGAPPSSAWRLPAGRMGDERRVRSRAPTR